MYSNTVYTSLDSIGRRVDHLKLHSKAEVELNLSPFLQFSSMKNQSGKGENIFPLAEPSLIGATSDCLQCYYGFQLDTYMNGCSHECTYCWAKAELSKIDKWNNPVPVPADISTLWELFYKAFETDEKFPLREILLKRTPLRIGAMSDPFLSMEKKYGVTLETLKLLNAYDYPFLFLTRSPKVADDEYLKYMPANRSAVQFSIPSLNEEFVQLVEPGTESPYRRLEALKKLNNVGIWTTVRLNPLFPNYSDGTFSEMKKTFKEKPVYNFFHTDMLSEMKDYGCKSLLTGFVHMDGKTTEAVSSKLGFDLRDLMKPQMKSMTTGFKFSHQEIRSYYEVISSECKDLGINFSTCYLGLGESYFWKDQDLWKDKNDCCNLKGNVPQFKSDTRELGIISKVSVLHPEFGMFKRIFNQGLFYKLRSFLLKHLWN